MKKLITLLSLMLAGFTLYACQSSQNADIITTMYPQYDIAKEIVEDKLTVSLLTAPGVEIHDFEPTSKQIVSIKNSKLFIYTSKDIDTWIKDDAALVGKDTLLINLSEGYTLLPHNHNHEDEDEHNHEHEDEDHHDHDHASIHFWTDPTTFIQLIDTILEKIVLIDSENANFYTENANVYKAKLTALHNKIDAYLSSKDATIYYAGHNALEAFGSRYHLEIIALSNTNKPDADLTSAQITTLANEVKKLNIHYIFTEELKEPKVAKAIKTALGDNYKLELLEFHGYHNISKKDFDDKLSYYDLLEKNFSNLKLALGN